MCADHADGTTHRLGMLMHQLRGVAGPSPEDLVDIDLPRHQLRALLIVARHGPFSVIGRRVERTVHAAAGQDDPRRGHRQQAPAPLNEQPT